MHNLSKIKLFRILLWMVYPISFIIVYPLVLLKRKSKSGLFFFFDRYAIGGAQRVYLEILESVEDIEKTVFFTRRSPNDKLRDTFYNYDRTTCYDIHFWTDNLLFRLFSVHYYALYLNRHNRVRILGSNSTFFYDLLPFLNRQVVKVELLHNFSYSKNGMEFFGLANHQYLDKRMVIDAFTRLNIINQYREYGVDESYDERVILVEYGVHVPNKISKENLPPLKVLYAGRGTPQKRIWLLNRIAEHFIGKSNVQFLFAGTMADELSAAVKKNYRVYNEIGDRSEMDKLFVEAHAIILTSSFEGFPVVVKEGMACGCVPVVTALPGNKTHLTHMLNALLIETFNDEDKVVEIAIEYITTLSSKHDLLEQLSRNAYEYALKKFGKQPFRSAYRNMLS